VIFDRKGTLEGLFEAKSLLDPIAPTRRESRIAKPPARQPEFLTEPDFFRTSWPARIGTILSRYPVHLTLISNKLFRDVPIRPRRFAGKQMAFSAVLHACAFLLLPFLLRYFPFQVTQAANIPPNDQHVLYYTLANPERHLKAPTIRPPGPGSTPGTGTAPELPPVPGASASHAALFAVSHPKVPDNDHQTILQPLSQPDLKMKADLKLPNLFLSKPQAPKVPLQFNPNSVKPLQRASHEVTTVAPTLTAANVQQPLTDALLAEKDGPFRGGFNRRGYAQKQRSGQKEGYRAPTDVHGAFQTYRKAACIGSPGQIGVEDRIASALRNLLISIFGKDVKGNADLIELF